MFVKAHTNWTPQEAHYRHKVKPIQAQNIKILKTHSSQACVVNSLPLFSSLASSTKRRRWEGEEEGHAHRESISKMVERMFGNVQDQMRNNKRNSMLKNTGSLLLLRTLLLMITIRFTLLLYLCLFYVYVHRAVHEIYGVSMN